MNPELLRNLWLEFTPQRLAAMPAVLFLVFTAVVLTEGRGGLPGAAWWIGVGIGVLWGARRAAGAVAGEVAARTWDAQRASALTPMQMALGKLFGAPAYAWYGVGLCAAVHLGAGGVPIEAASLILKTALSHGVALFLSLVLIGLGGRASPVTSLPYLAGIAAGAWGPLSLAWLPDVLGGLAPGGAVLPWPAAGAFPWFGLPLGVPAFALLSMVAFWAWSVAGSAAQLRRELNLPGGVPVFACFLPFIALYAAGLGWSGGLWAAAASAFLALCALTSAAALLEPKSRQALARLLAGGRGAVPPSVEALLAALAVALVLTFGAPAGAGPDLVPALHPGGALPLAVVLFLARDIALVRLLSLRRGGMRGAAAAIVWLAVLYTVLPVALAAAGAEAFLVALVPAWPAGVPTSPLSLAAPGLQAVLLWALLAHAVRRPAAPPRPA